MKVLRWIGMGILSILGLIGLVSLFLLFQGYRPIAAQEAVWEWEAVSAIANVLVPIVVAVVGSVVTFRQVRLETANKKNIDAMQENQQKQEEYLAEMRPLQEKLERDIAEATIIAATVKHFQDEYGEDIKAWASLHRGTEEWIIDTGGAGLGIKYDATSVEGKK